MEENLNFVSHRIAEILGFSKLSIYSKVVLLKTFLQHFELRLCCKYLKQTLDHSAIVKLHDQDRFWFTTDMTVKILGINPIQYGEGRHYGPPKVFLMVH